MIKILRCVICKHGLAFKKLEGTISSLSDDAQDYKERQEFRTLFVCIDKASTSKDNELLNM